jgi:hypothetical protein
MRNGNDTAKKLVGKSSPTECGFVRRVNMKPSKLKPREIVQIVAALRFWGRAAETSLVHPFKHPMCKARFKDHKPMTLDEIETLIGRLDGSWMGRGLRPWEPLKWL